MDFHISFRDQTLLVTSLFLCRSLPCWRSSFLQGSIVIQSYSSMPEGDASYRQDYYQSITHTYDLHIATASPKFSWFMALHFWFMPPIPSHPDQSLHLSGACILSAAKASKLFLLWNCNGGSMLHWCPGQSTAEHTQGMMMTMRKWAKRELWARMLPWGPHQDPHPPKNSHSLDQDLHSA